LAAETYLAEGLTFEMMISFVKDEPFLIVQKCDELKHAVYPTAQ
jgi:hypothetical protein